MIEYTPRSGSGPQRNIKIVGIGGAGANALDRMALDGVSPAWLVAANTDAQALTASVAGEKIQLGREATRGLGSGGDPELGRCAAEEATGEIRAAVEGADAVFVLAGLGGGTGSGAAPLVTELARETGALVIAVVTMPFTFEGKRRAAQAAEALAAIQQSADAVVCFENDRMGEAVAPRSGIQTAFATADQTLSQSVLALGALLNRSGVIHLGFDDITAALRGGANARCLFGFGEADGDNRSFDALARALKNPLMDKGRLLRDCPNVLVQVSGGPDLTLDEVQLLMEEFNRNVDERTRILFGAAVDPALEGRISVTVLSSLGDAPAATSAVPRRAAAQPARPVSPPAVATPPRPVPVPEIPAVAEPEAIEAEPVFEAEPVSEEELPVAQDQPAAPRVEKPRGLRAATTQASLFGDEPAAPAAAAAQRIAPPVPGRMLQRPFPEKPAAPAPEPEPEPVPEAQAEPEPIPAPEPEPQPEPQPVLPPRPQPVRAPVRRPIPAAAPELIPADEAAGPAKAPQQEVMQFEPVTRGRFEKSEPTIVDGQDLDVPTYLRRRVKLR